MVKTTRTHKRGPSCEVLGLDRKSGLCQSPPRGRWSSPIGGSAGSVRSSPTTHERCTLDRSGRRLKVTSLYVTHDQVEAMTMADRVAVMRRGILQQTDAP